MRDNTLKELNENAFTQIQKLFDDANEKEKLEILHSVEGLCETLKTKMRGEMPVADFLRSVGGGDRLYLGIPYEALGVATASRLPYDNERRKYFIPGDKTVNEVVKIIRAIAKVAVLPEFMICVVFDELAGVGSCENLNQEPDQ